MNSFFQSLIHDSENWLKTALLFTITTINGQKSLSSKIIILIVLMYCKTIQKDKSSEFLKRKKKTFNLKRGRRMIRYDIRREGGEDPKS